MSVIESAINKMKASGTAATGGTAAGANEARLGAAVPRREATALRPYSRGPATPSIDSPAGETHRGRLILAAVAGAALLGVLAWAMKPAGRTAGEHRAAGHSAASAVPVRAEAASTGTVNVTVDALGTVTALKSATIHSRVDGPLLKVPFKEGQLVKAGDLLAQIDPSTFEAALTQAEGVLAKSEAQLAGARVDLDRYRGLLAKDSIASQTVDAQRFTVQQIEGVVLTDKAAVENARLQLSFTRITAPFDGRVGLRQVDTGNIVHASDANGLVVLTQTHPIYVVFAVPSQYLPQINGPRSRGDPQPVEALDRDGKLIASGQLDAVDNQIDTTTGTIKLKALYDNNDNVLFPAEFVTARLHLDALPGATLIPSAAVQRGAPGTFVYVVNADNTASLRKVSLGPASGDLVSVTDGIRPGEKVVIDGLDKLRDGAKIAVIADNTPDAVAPATPAQPSHKHHHERPTAGSAKPPA